MKLERKGALLIAVFGCASLGYASLGCVAVTETHYALTGQPGAPWGGDVRVLMESSPVPEGLTEVAIVQAVGKWGHADLAHVVEGLKDEARRLGCDIVVRVRIDQGERMASGSGVAARSARLAPGSGDPAR